MDKHRKFQDTVFSAKVIEEAIGRLGSKIRVDATITAADGLAHYDRLDQFLKAYPQGREASLSVSPESRNEVATLFTLVLGDNSTVVRVDGKDDEKINEIFAVFEAAAPSSKLRSKQKPTTIDVERHCFAAPLSWETLPQLADRLSAHGIRLGRPEVALNRMPDHIVYREWAGALADVRQNGEPRSYRVYVPGGIADAGMAFRVERGRYKDGSPMLSLWMAGIPRIEILDDVAAFLGLEPDESRNPTKSAFIAHRFDAEGEQVADRLARFLALLGFDVKTGRSFSPRSIGAKVKDRMSSQSVVFVVLTPGEDPTWLAQESTLGHAKDKPLFILRDTRAEFKSALLGDVEYIQFTAPAIEGTFIPILEGLQELGFFDNKRLLRAEGYGSEQ